MFRKGREKMAFIVDIIIVATLLLSVLFGYKRGFIKTLFSCFSLIAAIVLAAIFGGPVGGIIKNSPLFDGISGGVTKEITEQVDSLSEAEMPLVQQNDNREAMLSAADEESDTSNMQNTEQAKNTGRKIIEDFSNTDFGRTVFKLGVDSEQIKNDFGNAIDNSIGALSQSDSVKGLLVSLIAGPVLDCVAAALGTVIVFVLALILLKIACFFLDKVFRLPLLSSVNKYGGLVAGVVSGFITVFVLCMAAQALIPVIPQNPILYSGMEDNTLLYGFFTGINPVSLFVF